jgi:16S rRNA (guanine527-N7)-methyltransferase
MTEVAHHSGLLAVLGEAQRIGALGVAPLTDIITHAHAFADALPDSVSSCIDLGTGAGIPGLVIAVARPTLSLTLVDRRAKRTDALVRAVRVLGVTDRVSVVCADMMYLARQPEVHHQFDAAVTRGFGPPDITLPVAASCVRSGGVVVISEPPTDHPIRWTPAILHAAHIRSWERRGPVAVFHVEHPEEQ